MTTPELLPCPKGCPTADLSIEKTEAFRRVKCDCGWTGPKRKNSVRAIIAWNTRAPASDAQIAAAIKAEREACAAAVDRWLSEMAADQTKLTAGELRVKQAFIGLLGTIAAAIRARGGEA